MLGQALVPILIPRLSGTFPVINISLSRIFCQHMRWIKVALRTAKFFRENFLNIKLCQLTKYQDKNFTSPDIKESVFLKSSLGT